jgi:hypothetical protein
MVVKGSVLLFMGVVIVKETRIFLLNEIGKQVIQANPKGRIILQTDLPNFRISHI